MAYDNSRYEGFFRFGMFGKDAIEQWQRYTNYILEIDLSTVDKTPLLKNAELVVAKSWTKNYFLYLYNTVGKDYKWWYYNYKSDEFLDEYLNNSDRQFITLMYNGEPSGMSILKYDQETNKGNLEYFGLCPHTIGKGLGRAFLHDSIIKETKTDRMWVYTGSYDHPAALPNYKAVGFKIIKIEDAQEYIPDCVIS